MNDRLSRLYLLTVCALVLAALVWPLMPLSTESAHQEAGKFLGFLVLGTAFFLCGIFGLYLCYRRQMIFEVAIWVFLTPFFFLLALMAEENLTGLSYLFPLPFVLGFSYLYWRRL